jgi:hypothetical protein
MRREVEVPRLRALFEEELQSALEVDDIDGVIERDAVGVTGLSSGGTKAIPHRRVHEVDPDDVADLTPDRPSPYERGFRLG